MRLRVRSLALLSGLRIWHCHELWCADVAWIWRCCGSGFRTPSLGTSICFRCGPWKDANTKKKKKKKKKFPSINFCYKSKSRVVHKQKRKLRYNISIWEQLIFKICPTKKSYSSWSQVSIYLLRWDSSWRKVSKYLVDDFLWKGLSNSIESGKQEWDTVPTLCLFYLRKQN